MTQKAQQPNNYAFIDSQNLNLGTQKMGWKLDWRKFRQYLLKEYGVKNAYLFIGYLAENQPMYEYLHEMGYLLVLKPTLDIKAPETPEGEPEAPKPATKGNVDADLVLYAMKELPNYDKAIIVSGDGDFYGLVEYLAQQNKLLNVLAPNWQYSSLLKPFESHIVRLDQMRRQLMYHDRRKK